MSVSILQGDVRAMLATLPAELVQVVCTSPPYFALRAYGTNPQVWGGDPEHAHEWQEGASAVVLPPQSANSTLTRHGSNGRSPYLAETAKMSGPREHAFCPCGAWLGELGSEPTPALFIEHLVSIFDEVGRVMRPDACLFVNLGDSYSGGGKGPTGASGIGNQAARQGFVNAVARGPIGGIPPKNLLLIPERFAIAMQDAGWIVRSRICWAKSSAMPESVRDRPTSAWEVILMFTKQARYFYDADAVRQPVVREYERAGGAWAINGADALTGLQRNGTSQNGLAANASNPAGANLRNYWLLKEAAERLSPEWNEQQQEYAQQALAQVWQKLITEQPDVLDAPLWLLGPEPSREQHYAAFPSEIPRRCILAATSERGQCPACGAPWVRVVERGALVRTSSRSNITYTPEKVNGDGLVAMSNKARDGVVPGQAYERSTTGWKAGCSCDAGDPVPQLVLDPFLGSGTTALVADQLGRNAVGIELNQQYVEIARKRITNDCPMFVDVEVAG